jgi:polyisoprenoid-binding protein YceI
MAKDYSNDLKERIRRMQYVGVKKAFQTIVLFFLAECVYGADHFVLDPPNTSVTFAVRHLMINNVKGSFTDVSGTIDYDSEDITRSSVDATIKSATINTGNADRDKHLRSADFLDVEKFPQIRFKSSRIEKRAENYVAIGTLTIRGVSREVVLPFNFLGQIKDPFGHIKIGAEASLTLDRRDYGISWSKIMDNGGLVVANEVKIEISFEAVKK